MMAGTGAHWTQAERNRLVVLFGQGLSASSIAKQLGCSRNAVCGQINRLRARNILPPARPATAARTLSRVRAMPPVERSARTVTWTKEERRLVLRLMAEGHGKIRIGRQIGRQVAAVGRLMEELRKETGSQAASCASQSPAEAVTSRATASRADTAASASATELRPESLRGRAASVVVVPMPFVRALGECRCLFFAADPMTKDGPDMLVCGHPRAPGSRKPYCATHIICEAA